MGQNQSTNNNNQSSSLNNKSLTSSDDQSKSQRIHQILSKDKKSVADIEEALVLLDGMEKLYPEKNGISLLKSEGSATERDQLIKQLSDSLINQGYQSAIAYYMRGKLEKDGKKYFQIAQALYKTHGKRLTYAPLEHIKFRQKFKNTTQGNEPPTLSDIQLPTDVWNSVILPYLTAGPYVEIIHGDPSDEQKKLVTAQSQPVPNEKNPTTRPVVNAYHLIIKNKAQGNAEYSIGFCNTSGHYATAKVHDKCSLNNYLSGNPTSIDPNGSAITRDPELIRYIQELIRENKGHTAHPARDVAHLSQADTTHFAFFQPELQKDAFKKLLDAVVRSEYDRVEEVLESHPELLLSAWKGTVTDKDIAERNFCKPATVFQLAFWAGDWEMWRRMLKAIPPHLKKEYEDDLREQLIELKEKGLTYTLDNLKACGLRILDEEPSEALKVDVCERNAYLFIIDQQTGDCSLGFKDPETGQYKAYKLDPTSDLVNRADELQQALDDHRNRDKLPHCVIRDEPILELARQEIKKYGGQTFISETSTSHDLTPLLDALDEYVKHYSNWTDAQQVEHWCVKVGWAQRLLPASVWNWWMNPKIDWGYVTEKDFDRQLPTAYRPAFYNDASLFSLALPFGDKYAAGALRMWAVGCLGVVGGGGWGVARFVKSFLSSKESKVKSLMRDLGCHSTHKQSPDCKVM